MTIKTLVTVFALLLLGSTAKAQTVANSYLQTRNTSGTYLAPSTTTAIFGTNWLGTGTATATVTIPFSFNYLGTNYTTCYVNPNGYITFGATSAGTNYTPMTTPDAGVTGIVAAMACNYVSSANAVTYGVTGSAPNRVFSISWTAAKFGASMTNTTLNFQINLFETTNRAEIVYNSPSLGSATGTLNAQVGIGGASTSDFLNWTETASSTTTTAGGTSGVNWVLLKPAVTSGSTCALQRATNAAYFPATNLALDYTPYLTLLSPSAINNTGFTINWVAATGAANYKIEVGTTATLSTLISGSPITITAPATSTVITGLTTGTKYWYRVTPNYATYGLTSASQIYPITMPVITPLSISSGFNFDIVADGSNTVGGTASIPGSVNCVSVARPGFDNANNVLAAQDFYNGLTINNLPIGGSVPETGSSGTAGVVYQLAPYFQNNCFWFQNGSSSTGGTMAISSPASATALYIMSISGNGTNTATYTVNFSDTATPLAFTGVGLNDWCTSNTIVSGQISRANVGGGADGDGLCPYMYRNILSFPSGYYNKTITGVSVTLTGSTSTYPAIFAISALRTAVISSTALSLTGFATPNCTGISSSQTITLSGSKLTTSGTANAGGTGNITVTAPTGFKVSLNNTTFTSTVTIPFSSCSFASTALYVRMESTTIGYNTGNITFSGVTTPTANLLNIPLTGVVGGVQLKPSLTNTYPTVRGTISFGVVTNGVTSPAIVDSFAAYGLTGDVTVTSSNPSFQYSLDGTTYSSSVTIPATGGQVYPSIPFYTKVTPSGTGAQTATVTMGGGAPAACTYTFKDSVYGAPACINPNLATSLVFSGTNNTLTSIGFTPSGTADGYLLVRSTAPFVAGSDPVTGTNYAVNAAFGNGNVVSINNSAPPYSNTGLTGNTNYYYTVVPFNGGSVGGTCGGGPLYAAGTQLTGNVTTCPGTVTGLTSSVINGSSFSLSWTAPTGGTASAITYLVDVSTTNTFTSPITGSPFTISGTSLSMTGLLASTPYYVRVTTIGSCNSAATSTLTVTTTANYLACPIASGFNSDIVASGSASPFNSTSFPSPIAAFDNGTSSAGYDLVAAPYSFSTVTYKLPASGSFISTATTPGLAVQLADYTAQNALVIHTSGTSYPTNGTLVLTTPVYASVLYVTGISASAITTVNLVALYTDGTSDSTTGIAYPDWYSTGVTSPIGFALQGIGRINGAGTSNDGTATTPSLFYGSFTLPTAGQSKKIQSVRVRWTSGTGYLAVMAASVKAGSLVASASSVPAFTNVPACSSSSAQSFTITGNTLFPSGSTIIAKAPTGFQVSNNGTAWDSVASITYSGNALSATSVYVRFSPATVGTFTGNVTFTGGTVNNGPLVAVSGTSTGLSISPVSVAAFGPVGTGTSSAGQHYTITGTGLTAGTITITSSNSVFQVSPDSVTWSSTYNFANGTTLSAPLFIRFSPVATGAQTSSITLASSSMSCLPAAIAATGTGALPCSAPSVPTTLTFTGTSTNGTSVGFTPVGAADGYVIVKSFTPFATGGALGTGTVYAVGDTLGNGKVVTVSNAAPPFSVFGLNGNSTYYYTAIPFVGGTTGTCVGGPIYATGTQLSGAVVTCPGVATTLVSSAVTGAGFTLNWSAPAGGSVYTVYYVLDVSSSSTFASDVTSFVTTSTNYAVTGLGGTTQYYYRIHDSTTACNSAYTATGSVTTGCGITPLPYLESFESITTANTLPACMASTNLGSLTLTYLAATGSYNQAGHTGTKFASFRWAPNDWFFTPSFNFVAGYNYKVTFWYVTDGAAGFLTLKAAYGSSQTSGAMTTNIGTPITNPANTTYAQYSGTFSPTTTGTYNVGIYGYGTSSTPWYMTIDDINVTLLPTLIASPSSINAGSINVGATGSSSFNLSGTGLTGTGNVTITAPTGYQVSTSASSGFASSINVPYTSSSLASTPIYVNFSPTATGVVAGNIVCTGSSTSVTVAVTGTGVVPTFTPSPTSLNLGSSLVGVTSVAQTVTITGAYLLGYPGTITLTSTNTDYQISNDGGATYHSTLSIPYTSASVSPTIYVNFTPGTTGASTGSITMAGGSVATPPTITLTGNGASAPCSAPVVPTSVSYGSITATSTTATITTSSPATGYLVVASTGTLSGAPVDYTTYSVGNTIGSGTIVAMGTSATIPVSSLAGNTTYTLTIFPYNSGTCAGPIYNGATPVSGSVTTCPAVPAFTTITPLAAGITFNWGSVSGGSASTVTYSVDVSTNSTFTALVAGSPFTATGSATSLTATGLLSATTYYYRIKASTASCTSAYTTVANTTTTSYCSPNFTTSCSSGYYTNSIAVNGYVWNGTLASCGTSNYTSTVFTVTAGVAATYTSTTTGYTGCSVWIDLNGDGDFFDAGEMVIAQYSGNSPGLYNTTLTIPTSVTTGTYRMRAIAGWGTSGSAGSGNGAGPCGSNGTGGIVYSYGGFQDFSIYVQNPILTSSATTLTAFGNIPTCTNTASQNFTISGSGLIPSSGNVVAHAPYNSGIQLSTNGTAWDTTATYAYTGGVLSTSTVYARYAPTLVGSVSSNITFTGGGALSYPTVGVSGSSNGLTLSSTAVAAFGPINVSSSSSPISYSVTGSGLTAGTTTVASSNPDFQVSPDNVTYSTTSYNFANGSSMPATSVYIKFTPTTTGPETATITITSPTGCVMSISATGAGATPCSAPALPTAIAFTGTTASATTVGFTPTGSADGYLVVRSYSAFVPGSDPVTAHQYAVSDTFGNGRVVFTSTSSSYPVTGLTANTAYYYTIVPFNGGTTGTCTGGPLYPSGTQLTGSVVTCPSVPGTPTATPTASGMTISWAASAGGTGSAINYSVDVSSNVGFTAPVTGSPFTVPGPTTSLSFGGLSATTTYYFRVKAVTAVCTSATTTVGNATTTQFDYTTVTMTGGSYNQDVIAEGTAIPTVSTTTQFDAASYDFLSADYHYSTFTPTSSNQLPASGAFTSAITAGLPYQLAAYTGNNCLQLLAGSSGTLTLATPQYASQLYLTASSGSGAATSVTFTINYADGTTETGVTTTVADWYGGTPIALASIGRVLRTSGATEAATGGPNLYEYYLPVSAANYTKQITSIGVNYAGTGGSLGIFAVSKRGGALYASSNVLSAFTTTNVGCNSNAQTFTISGSTLYPSGGNITATAPTGFQVSNNGTSWGTTATFAYTANTMSSTTVYVRFAPGTSGAISGNVTFTGGTANNTPVVAVSGTGTITPVGLTSSAPLYCTGGSSVTLTASGLVLYSWAPSAGLSATTGSTISATPSATTVYTVTGTDVNGCTAFTNTITVTNNNPTTSITGPSSTLCLPGVMALTEGGTGGTWTSSDPSIATVASTGSGIVYGVNASPTPITITYNNSACGGSATYNVTVSTGGFTVVTSPGSGTYCSTGSPLAITATGATSYSWSPALGLDATTGATVNASPSATTVYTVVGTSGVCSNAATVYVGNNTPGAITGGVTSLCPTITNATTWSDTTASGTWTVNTPSVATITSGGAITALAAGSATITYTRAGCYVVRNLTVNPLPTITATPAAAMICGGVSTSMTASGASTYSWSPSTYLSAVTGATVTCTATGTTTYVITGTSSLGCVNTLNKTVSVGPTVTAASAVGSASVCPGGSTTLTSSGSISNTYYVTTTPYALATLGTTTAVTGDDVFSGMITLPFTFNYFGTNYTQVNINTNGLISFTNTASGSTTGYLTNYSCPSTNLQGETGAGIAFGNHDCIPSGNALTYGTVGVAPNRKFVINYSSVPGFSGTGVYSGQLILNENNSVDMMITSLTPGTSTYSSTFGLQSNTGTVGVAVPNRNAMASTVSISTPEGWHFTRPTFTYAWTPASSLSSSTISGPVATVATATTYTVTVADSLSGCNANSSVSVGTYTLPTVTIPTPTIGCAGTAMTASGASTYTWSPATGLSATVGATVTPNASISATTYTVTGTDAHTCVNTASILVNPVPTVSVTPSSLAAICNGGSVTMTASGADTYTWTNSATLSSSTAATVTAAPATTTTYSVTGRYVTGCASILSPGRVLTVNSTPLAATLTAASGYCLGSGTPYTISTGTPAGTGVLSSYNWSGPNAFSTTTASPSVSFTPSSTLASGIYSLTVTYPGAGCTSAPVTTASVTVANYPVAQTVTGGNGCSASGITVGLANTESSAYAYALKMFTPPSTTTTVATLNGTSAAVSYSAVTTAGSYFVVATGPGGCQTTMTGGDTITSTPTVASITPSATALCTGSTLTLTAGATTGSPTTYSWSGPGGYATTGSATTQSFTVAPVASGIYSLTVGVPGCVSSVVTSSSVTATNYPAIYNVTGGNGCTSAGITVGTDNSEATATYKLTMLPSTTVYTVTGTGSPVAFTPVTTAGQYIVTATAGPAACLSAMTGTDTVNLTPSISLGTPANVCQPITSSTVAFSSAFASPTTYNIAWGPAAATAGFANVAGNTLSGSSIALSIPSTSVAGSFDGNITVSNGACTSSIYPAHFIVYAHPTVTVTSAAAPCMGYAGTVYFAGTDSATVDYTMDGGSVNSFIFSGTTSSLSTGTITSPHTYIVLSAHNPVCSTPVNDTFTITPVPMAWIGGATSHETEWTEVTNWTCGFAPGLSDDVFIDAALYAPVVLATDAATVRDLKLSSTANMTINSGADLNIKGNLTNNNRIGGAGKVVLSGASAQRITGVGTVNNIELNNTAGATIDTGSRMMVGTALYVTSGILSTNDSLELLSADTSITARIAPIPTSGASISGRVRADQYIQAGFRRYRFFGHPFSDPISLSQMNNYIDITGLGGYLNGFQTTSSNSPSAFRLDPLTGNDTMSYDPAWKPITKINALAADTNMFNPGQGLRVFVRGSKGQGLSYTGYYGMYYPLASTTKMMGHVNQGPLTLTMRKGATNPDHQELNMLANPYPSPIDIGSILYYAKAAGQVTGSAFYVWDPTLPGGGNYLTIPIEVAGAISPYYIQANTSFQVRAHHDSATLNFVETDKHSSADNYLFKSKVDAEYAVLNVYDAGYNLWDKLRLQFNDGATDNNDRELDAPKQLGADFTFYSLSAEGRKLAIDARPFSADKIIPLGITSQYEQQFIIRADNVAIPAGGTLYLHDKLLGKTVEMPVGGEYHFAISKDKATQGDNRFELGMRPATAIVTAFNVSMSPNPATDDVKITFTSAKKENVSVRVMDITGISVYNKDLGEQQNGTVSVPLSTFASGIYMVELTQGSQKVIKKLVKE